MGGSLGLGGSDNRRKSELLGQGASEIANGRARSALASIGRMPCSSSLTFVTCGGEMGEKQFTDLRMKVEVVYNPPDETSSEDSTKAVGLFLEQKVDLILFVGGDGTARDVCSKAGQGTPILGIPSGVKMHSSIFLNTPDDAGKTLQAFFEFRMTLPGEIMDVDEDEFRAGRVSSRLFCVAAVPDAKGMIQPTKSLSDSMSEEEEMEEISEYLSQNWDPNALYVLSTGSTVASVSRKVGIDKNELSVNAIFFRKEMGSGLSEKQLLDLVLGSEKVKLIVTPIGGQGFLFGRGNQQISARVLREIDNDDIIIVATPTKLSRLTSLRVDTGDIEMDGRLRGFWKVLTGYAKYRVMQIQ